MRNATTVNIGRGRWRGLWVSKSDVIEYIRCPYRVYLSHITGVPIGEMKDSEAIGAILERGIQLESRVISEGRFREVKSDEKVETLLDKDLVLRAPVLFRNHELGIQGIPDLIDAGRGKLYPIEIKVHREVTDSDELELAFYWLLLEPYRKGKAKPKGYVLLGTGETVEVNLTRSHMFDVLSLVEDTREVKEKGTTPTLSKECKLCTLADDCRSEVSRRGGLSLIDGIAYIREHQLEGLGVMNIADFAKADGLELHENWRSQFGTSPGLYEIRRMQLHALAWIVRKPIFFGELDSFGFLDKPLVIMDLEYDPESYIWLVGLCIKTRETKRYQQYFAEKLTATEEKRILSALTETLGANPKHCIVTYGASADMPQLRKAWIRQGFSLDVWYGLEERHVDLYTFVRRNFRFPLASHGLKDVESFLGFKRKGERMDGLHALGLYNHYFRVKKESRRIALKQKLLDYNRQDLDSAAFIVGQLKSLPKECIHEELL